MKKYLNTLFVTTQGAWLSKKGETVVVKIEQKERLRIPLLTLDGIVCFGNVAISPFLMGFCAERDVTISFLTENGRFLARVTGPVSGNVLLRREQYRKADDTDFCADFAASLITAKIFNCRHVLKRLVRDHAGKINRDAVNGAIERLNASLQGLKVHKPLDEVRGIEGDGAYSYFQVFDHLILRNKEDFFFRKRNRRPPMDRVNCLLSFVYTLMMHDVRSALESVGLDPAVGFLHRDRPGRMGLALDIMEEFRPMVDRFVVSLVNLGQVKAKGFKITSSGGVRMDDDTRKTVLAAWQKRKQETVTHPFLAEKMAAGLLFFAQALLLARFLRGDIDGYPPMFFK